jgi:hypothetical protein
LQPSRQNLLQKLGNVSDNKIATKDSFVAENKRKKEF